MNDVVSIIAVSFVIICIICLKNFLFNKRVFCQRLWCSIAGRLTFSVSGTEVDEVVPFFMPLITIFNIVSVILGYDRRFLYAYIYFLLSETNVNGNISILY